MRHPSPDYTAIEAAGKPEVMFQRSHEKNIVDLKVSPDGRIIVSASLDRTVKIWNIEGVLLKTVPFPDTDIRCLAVSPDGSRIAVGSRQGIFELSIDGRLLRTLKGEDNAFSAHYEPRIVYSPDGGILTTTGSRTLLIRDKEWNIRKRLKAAGTEPSAPGDIRHIAVSPDGKYFVTCGDAIRTTDGWMAYARVWDPEGNPIADLVTSKPPRQGEKKKKDSCGQPKMAAISPDGSLIALISGDICLFSKEGDFIRTIPGKSSASHVKNIMFTPDGKAVIVNEFREIYKYYVDGRYGGKLKPAAKDDPGVGGAEAAVITNDGSRLVTGHQGDAHLAGGIRIWDRRGKLRKDLRPMAREAKRIFFSPDGKTLYLETQWGKETIAWNLPGMYHEMINESVRFTREGKEFRFYEGKWQHFHLKAGSRDVEFKERNYAPLPDGTVLDWNGRVWDSEGAPSRNIAPMNPTWELAAEPTMRYFVTIPGRGSEAKLHNSEGKHVGTIRVDAGERLEPGAAAGYRDMVALGHEDGLISLFRIDEGKFLKSAGDEDAVYYKRPKIPVFGNKTAQMKSHLLAVRGLAFSPDGKYLASCSADRTIRVWNLESRAYITLVALANGDWYAFDEGGRFECSSGAWDQVVFVKGLTAYDARQMWDALYEPGLIISFLKGMRAAPVNLAKALNAAPEVTITVEELKESDETVTVNVCARPHGNGVGRIFVLHNGRSIDESARGIKIQGSGNCKSFSLALEPGKNEITGAAYDAANTVFGTSQVRSVTFSPPAMARPGMHILAVGVSEYRDANIRLGYPADDARAVTDAFNRTGMTLYGKITMKVLTDRNATRDRIRAALKELAAGAQKNDMVVIFLAGHGDTEDGVYYYLAHDADLTNLKGSAISADELSAFTRTLPASKVMLLFDTCKSGAATAALQKLAAARGFDERKIIARIAKEHGIAVFSAASMSQEAYEIKALQHGIFTYCLVSALGGPSGEIAEDGIITAARLLARVNRATRETAMRYLRIEQTPIVYIFGDDFGIGKSR